MLLDIEDQHVRLLMEHRPEPHVLLLDEKAAHALAYHRATFRLEGLPTLLLTGDSYFTSVGRLMVIRVPDTKGKPLVLDQWGRTAP